QNRLLAHPVDEDVRRTVDENGMADAVAPVVVMGETPERCLHAAEHERDVGEQLLEPARVHRARVVRPSARGRVGRVRVGRTTLLAGGVVVHHRVHVAARDAEEETRTAAGREVGQSARLVPARLAERAGASGAYNGWSHVGKFPRFGICAALARDWNLSGILFHRAMADTSAPTMPFAAEDAAPRAIEAADPLEGDWSEGLRGP